MQGADEDNDGSEKDNKMKGMKPVGKKKKV